MSASYDQVIRSGLNLKKTAQSISKKKHHVKPKLNRVDASASGEGAAESQDDDGQVGLEGSEALTLYSDEKLTAAEKAYRLALKRRQKERIGKRLELTHRQRMERLNAHLSTLSEHFDIPKVGPG